MNNMKDAIKALEIHDNSSQRDTPTTNDPIRPVIEAIKDSEAVHKAWEKSWLKSRFLNKVAEVFENHGFETTRIYLLDKKEKNNLRGQSEALLAVLECMVHCPAIKKRRAIGRTIIKTLIALGKER